MVVMQLILLLGFVFGLIYYRAPVILWTVSVAIVLILLTRFGSMGFFFLSLSWLSFIAAALFANLKQQRMQYFTKPLVKILSSTMPSISKTESEAIEAGDVWWEKELFCGRPDWKKLLDIPQPKLTDEEQAFIDNQVETLCNSLNDWKIVYEDYDMPEDVWEYLKKERFFGMVIPKEYGGRGFSALAHSTIIMKIATRSISAAVNTMVPNSLGPGELLVHYGTQEQKNYYLPRLARGEDIPCFALTAPEAGSDAGSITDFGVVCRGQYQGRDVLGIRLNWDKRYITLAPVATVLGVAIRLYDPDHLIGKEEDVGITLCLVPTNTPGVEIGNRHWPMHMAFMNGATRGKDVFIPLDGIIGGVDMAGQGWRMLMECLSIGRSISLPALSTACGKFTFRASGAYSRVRRQFKTAISQFEGVEEALANIAGMTYLLDAARIMTAGATDMKIKPAIASAIAKYHMTEMARKVIAHSMDVHAGQAIQMGPRNYLAVPHMSIPISITVEGANILTRNLIIFGQGAIRCHPYILKEIQWLSSDDKAKKYLELDKLILSHIGYALSNLVRTLWSSLTAGKLLRSPVKGPVANLYKQLTRMSAALALLSDISMLILGGQLKRKERISARLGDMLSELYLASSVLKYYQDQGQPQTDLDYVNWAVQKCLHHVQVACDDLCANFPIKWLGTLLRIIIFPYGTAFRKPSDKLDHAVVSKMIVPSEFRDRVIKYSYAAQSMSEPLGRLEIALKTLQDIDPLVKKFQVAVRDGVVPKHGEYSERLKAAKSAGILTKEEVTSLLEYDALQKEIIKVDEFSFDLSKVLT